MSKINAKAMTALSDEELFYVNGGTGNMFGTIDAYLKHASACGMQENCLNCKKRESGCPEKALAQKFFSFSQAQKTKRPL